MHKAIKQIGARMARHTWLEAAAPTVGEVVPGAERVVEQPVQPVQ